MLTDPTRSIGSPSVLVKSIGWWDIPSPDEEEFPWLIETHVDSRPTVPGFVVNTHTVITSDKGQRYAY